MISPTLWSQAERKLLLGPAYADLDLVTCQEDGQLITPQAFSQAFVRLLKRAKLRRVRVHDLRHSHATQLLRQGVHPKIVSERLGHATISITLDTYSHVLPGMQEDAARRVDAALRAAMGQ